MAQWYPAPKPKEAPYLSVPLGVRLPWATLVCAQAVWMAASIIF